MIYNLKTINVCDCQLSPHGNVYTSDKHLCETKKYVKVDDLLIIITQRINDFARNYNVSNVSAYKHKFEELDALLQDLGW